MAKIKIENTTRDLRVSFLNPKTDAVGAVYYIPKEGLLIIQENITEEVWLKTMDTNESHFSGVLHFKHSDISDPVTADLSALVAQLLTWKNS